METPTSLMEAIKFFADPDNAINYLVAIRWPADTDKEGFELLAPISQVVRAALDHVHPGVNARGR